MKESEAISDVNSEKDSTLSSIDSADMNAIEEVNSAYELVKEVDALDISKEGTDSWEASMKTCDWRRRGLG